MEWSRIQSKKHTITNQHMEEKLPKFFECVLASHHTQGKWYISGAGVCEPASSLKFPLLLERTRYFRQLPNFPPMCWWDGNDRGFECVYEIEDEVDGRDEQLVRRRWMHFLCSLSLFETGIWYGWVRVRGWVTALYLSLFILFIAQNFKIRTKKVVNLEDLINLFFDYNIKHIESTSFFLVRQRRIFFRLVVNFGATDGVIPWWSSWWWHNSFSLILMFENITCDGCNFGFGFELYRFPSFLS